MRGRGVESVWQRWRGQDGGTESDTKRQQLAAISVKFVHDNQVYRSMLSLIHFYLLSRHDTGWHRLLLNGPVDLKVVVYASLAHERHLNRR